MSSAGLPTALISSRCRNTKVMGNCRKRLQRLPGGAGAKCSWKSRARLLPWVATISNSALPGDPAAPSVGGCVGGGGWRGEVGQEC